MAIQKETYKVSVIIPVYNTEKYLEECVLSIINQTQKDVEIIIVDDGSTDNSYMVACALTKKYSNVAVYHQKNKKLGAARNAGLEKARGKYVLFLDSDDYLESVCLKTLYDIAEANQLEVVTYDAKTRIECELKDSQIESYKREYLNIDVDKVWNGREFFQDYYCAGGVFSSACLLMLNRMFLIENKINFKERIFYEDNEFMLKVFFNASKLKYCPEQLYIRRYRDNSIMTQKYTKLHLSSALSVSTDCLNYLINNKLNGFDISIQRFQSTLYERVLIIFRNIKDEIKGTEYAEDLLRRHMILDVNVIKEKFNFMLMVYYCGILKNLLEINLDRGLSEKKKLLLDLVKTLDIEIAKGLNQIKEKYDIDLMTSRLCIYGTGKMADNIVDFLFPKIKDAESKFVFAKSSCEEGEKYRGKYILLQLDKIERYSIKGILISSPKYEKEMKENVYKLYGNRYKCYTYTELGDIDISMK